MDDAQQRQFRYWRWRIFGITWLAYAGFYLTRKAFSVAKTELMKPGVMGLTKGQMSVMDGAYSGAYALGQFFWGAMGDRFGARKVILFGMMASIVTAAVMGFGGTAMVMGVLFTLQGFWQSSGWAPLAKNVGEFFGRKERGTIMGFWCTNYALGGFAATIIAGAAASRWGWQYAFFIPAALLLGIWVLFVVLQVNRPTDVGLITLDQPQATASGAPAASSATASAPTASESVAAIRKVLGIRMVWILAMSYFLVKPTRYLMLFWSPVYVSERLQASSQTAGAISSLFDLAGPLGTLVGGFLSDRLFASRRMPICVIALFLLATIMIAFPFVELTRLTLSMGMFAIGFLIFIPDSLISGTAAIDFGTTKGASTANGVINGCGSVGQMIGVMLPGLVEKLLGKGQDIWGVIFVGLGIALGLAGLLLAPQWNRVPKED